MTEKDLLIPLDQIQSRVLLIRGRRVIIDADLADLYGVETRRLNEQVKRNIDRFPPDFMFQLTEEEFDNLMSQIATSSGAWGGKRKLPYAFTEHGAIMAAAVLNSPRAVQVSVYVVRAFVKLREMLSSQKKLAEKFAELESKLEKHDRQITVIVDAIKQLMREPEKPKRRIGFKADDEK